MILIGVTGKKQGGKGETCKFLTRNAREVFGCEPHEVRTFPVAGPLKKFCVDVLGLRPEQVYGTDADKNTLTRYKWEDMPGVVTQRTYENMGAIDTGELMLHAPGRMTAREVLQFVGTDLFRCMNQDIHIEAVIRQIQTSDARVALSDDMRYPNEVAAVQAAGGVVMRLTRDPNNGADKHQSENALNPDAFDWNRFDAVIDNRDLTVSETNQKVVEFLRNKGIAK